MNRRITATITAVCIGVLFTGCSGNVDKNSEASLSESESETVVSQSDAVETALPEAESASEVNAYYDYIIDLLVEVRSGQADDDTMMTFTETMSPDFMYVSDDAPVFYTTIDIDGNGVDELLLYTKQFDEDGGEAAVIYDAYTVRNGEPVHFIAGGSRNVYYLASDSTFYNMGSSGAAYTGFATGNSYLTNATLRMILRVRSAGMKVQTDCGQMTGLKLLKMMRCLSSILILCSFLMSSRCKPSIRTVQLLGRVSL